MMIYFLIGMSCILMIIKVAKMEGKCSIKRNVRNKLKLFQKQQNFVVF